MPVHEKDKDQKREKLPAMQVICLRWVSEGKTLKDVAKIEGTSVSMVSNYLRDACSRFGVSSVTEAIAAASQIKLFQNNQATEKLKCASRRSTAFVLSIGHEIQP